MSPRRLHRGFTLVETLATCALAALAMALGAAALSGARDPLPRAEQTLLEVRAMARLVALSDGPATLRLEDGRLVVRDGHGRIGIEREWPDGVMIEGMDDGVRIDRLGRSDRARLILSIGDRRVELSP